MPTTISHRPPRNWLQIELTVSHGLSEYASHQLTILTGTGVQIVDRDDQETIIAYLEKDEQYERRRQELDALLADLTTRLGMEPDCQLSTIVEENWAENWKENYKPCRITPSITVKPSWESYSPSESEIVIAIDPGMAFGTGLHSSTRLALTFIDQLFASAHKPQSVLDVGTGTGILALAAAKLGAREVAAIDNDIDAVVAARDNIHQNSESIPCSDTDVADIAGVFDLVIANITADVLTLLCPELVKRLNSRGHLILAGILGPDQAKQVTSTFQAQGLELVEQKTEDNWFSLLFTTG